MNLMLRTEESTTALFMIWCSDGDSDVIVDRKLGK
jgi:hypothetical protein